MLCWHCDEELVLDFTTENFEKYYHCEICEKWYEMSKDVRRLTAQFRLNLSNSMRVRKFRIFQAAIYA